MSIKLYSIFHLNLMFSSLEEENRKEVISKCYWPLLILAQNGSKIGIELTGLTLELINSIDPSWVTLFRSLLQAKRIELIGSGYSQIIGPLVPAEVNDWNQSIGQDIYQKLLGVEPRTALINEMAYSAGVVEHYENNGYDSIIMEWNNPRAGHSEWDNEWRYYPQKVKGNNAELKLLWADSIAFQKFQRYAHGEYDLDEYSDYIHTHYNDNKIRYFPLYLNDVEIFDYRPGRYHTETIVADSEWDRIKDLYAHLKRQKWCNLIFPSEVLNSQKIGNIIKLESAAHPIPVKKQEKYNINRWALTGRNDLEINTKCYKVYQGLMSSKQAKLNDWKELCYLWSSDFRTHITDKRWAEYNMRLNYAVSQCLIDSESVKIASSIENRVELIEDSKRITINTQNYRLVLNKQKGLSVHELVIKKNGSQPLIGTIGHGFYEDIAMGADFYTGHAVIERMAEHKITDLHKSELEITDRDSIIKIRSEVVQEGYVFRNQISAYPEGILFKKTIKISEKGKTVIRPFCFTFIPDSWDKGSLFVESHNGGKEAERFYLTGQNLTHGHIYSTLISSRHGFGNTEGKFIVGDKNKNISFQCDMTQAALIASIVYIEMNDNYFFRIQYSASELDETRQNQNDPSSISLSIWVDIS
jgi:hypothetical protein